MKVKRLFIVVALSGILLSGCDLFKKKEPINNDEEQEEKTEDFDYTHINQELQYCYNYFKDTTNYADGTNGFGLTQDRLTSTQMSSIAATGFLLASYPVFVKENYLTYEKAKEYSLKTIETLLRIQADSNVSYGGCLSHFVTKMDGNRYGSSEVSTIDTALAVNGALVAGGYFGGEVLTKANEFWGNVDFTKFIVQSGGKSYISMGISAPNKPEDQLGKWDYYAEQMSMYILGVGNPVEAHRIDPVLYKNVKKENGTYNGISHIKSWFGSLFTYQYSNAFFNFKDYEDYMGRNYFENSVKASKTAYQYCVDNKDKYKTYSEVSWGLTACDTPLGYNGNLGTPPKSYGYNTDDIKVAGTIAPTAAIGSMPYTPNKSNAALKNYLSIKALCHERYGLKDSYNLDFNGNEWFDPDFIGIDKGIEVLQMANFKYDNFVSNCTMENPNVIRGFENNGFVKVNG